MSRICLLITITLLLGCSAEDRKRDQLTREINFRKANMEHANSLIKEVVYAKDSKTNLCFGYAWGGAASGGPVLVNVPCEAVGL